MGPLKLTDLQLDAGIRAAQPLTPPKRNEFLRELATALAGQHEVGDGQLFRAIREIQRRHFDPPRLDQTPRPSVAK